MFRAGSKRVEFLPIQWRAKLQLDQGTIDAITLPVNTERKGKDYERRENKILIHRLVGVYT